ncbi:gliding motility-associated C-terminal domain-containing protein [Algoriphagus sediminis]|uniref:Gliding motility-associated C-terminal domain-containing protein n=1 Tax=Algoriphagus sediminis TaxID=3057113 RepID=A0ABT7YD83_9BACT|nr:gliding motility-associated C-terminal domain-containing protein [Algoriphagus sediminis]MDN3204164.1 gliding motility-associated C-terminal domain-containing protein [Algoriphagus sediminis]
MSRIWIISILSVLMLASTSVYQRGFAQSLAGARLAADGSSDGPFTVSVTGKLALCSHSERGSIILDIEGGVAPYTFKWNTNETTQNRSNLYAGTYTVEITDSQGTLHIERIVVQPPYPLILEDLEKQNASCGSGNDGYAKIGVKIGRGEPYKVIWSHGLEDQWEAYDLAPGVYTVTVVDKYNCDVSLSFEIEAPNEGIEVTESITEVTCTSGNSGEVQLNVTGGQPPYQYSWNHGPSTSKITGLSAGTYVVTIMDQTGCAYQASYSLQSPSEIQVESEIVEPSCGGKSDGLIELKLTGGTQPYTVNWSNGNTGAKISNLNPGTYTASISDAKGCSYEQSFNLAAATELTVNVTDKVDLTCFNSNDGTAIINTNQPKDQLNILWSDGIKNVWSRNDLEAGNYTVQVSNNEGCSVETQFTIDAPDELSARIESTLEVDCAVGSVEGVAWVSISGGVEPYTINWNPSNASNREINFSQSSNLKVRVTDAMGCIVEAEARVDYPTNTKEGRLNFNYRKLEISSEPEVLTNEEIIFESEISDEFIAWEWSFGDGSKSVDKDPIHVFNKAGVYEVSLTGYDIYGCSSIETNVIQVNSPLEVVVIPNAFTPNGDGLNDTFMPKLRGIQEFYLEVFNTWGESMFITSSPEDKGWDGTYKGQLSPPGNYLYKITYRTPAGESVHRTGGVTLIR